MCRYRVNSPSHSHSFSLEWLWNHISHQNGAQRPISQVIDLMGLVAVGNFRDGLRELVRMLLCLLDLAGVVQLKVTNHTSSVEDSPRALQMVDAAGGGAGEELWCRMACPHHAAGGLRAPPTDTLVGGLLRCAGRSNSHATLNSVEESDHLHHLMWSQQCYITLP